MRFGKFAKMMGPIAAMAVMGAMAGCNGEIRINDEEGVPLSELDTSGEAPTEFLLMGPDRVTLTEGDSLVIEPSGNADEIEKLRFVLKDGTLGVHRENGSRNSTAVDIAITMPAPTKIAIMGSGSVTTGKLAREAEVAIMGSGRADTRNVDSKKLEVKIAGSGDYAASGNVQDLRLKIAGSGRGDMAGLKAETAEVDIAGSGSATFASDGTVEAKVVGSGDVTVRGSAKCTIKSVGSGTLKCEPGDGPAAPRAAAAAEAPEGPAAPEAPEAPKTDD